VSAAGRYRPEPLTDEQKAANDQAAAEAVALVAASYLVEAKGRPLNRRLRDQQVRAQRLARWMARQTQGGRP
jgi:hypothetical protein